MNLQTRILLVEDEPAQRLLLAAFLRQAGYQVHEASSLAESRAFLRREEAPNLVLLDLVLPDGNGLELAPDLLPRGIPVIILTCSPQERIPALELGVDDYLDKPFDPRELAARIQNVLRRSGGLPLRTIPLGTFRLDRERRRLLDRDGKEVDLTRGEFDLLAALLDARGCVLCRAELAEFVSADGAKASGRSVDVLVSRLRHKLEADPGNPRLLQTVPGLGYRLGI